MKNLFQQLYSWLSSLWAAWLNYSRPVAPVVITPTPSPVNPTPKPVFDVQTTLQNLMVARGTPITTTFNPGSGPVLINASIPAVTPAIAADMAARLVGGCRAENVDLVFIVSCMYQESRWSPGAYNHNLSATNPSISFDHTDWGCGQFSGVQARAWRVFQGLTETEMTGKLLDPAFAVPEFVAMYATKLALAKVACTPAMLAQIRALPDWCFQQTSDDAEVAMWYAAVAYNAGDTGVKEVIASGGYKTHHNADGTTSQVPEHHGHAIQTWMSQFRPILEPNVTTNAA